MADGRRKAGDVSLSMDSLEGCINDFNQIFLNAIHLVRSQGDAGR